jgi:hypothetical protein
MPICAFDMTFEIIIVMIVIFLHGLSLGLILVGDKCKD